MAAQFQIAFKGEIEDGQNVENVKQRLAALFKMNPTQVEALFSGKPVVIKKNIDEATALKYKAALKKAGAIGHVIAPKQASAPAKPAQAATPTSPKQTNTAPAGISASNAGDAPQTAVNLNIPEDLSSISMADAGDGFIVDPQGDVPEPDLDLSALSLAAEDSGYIEASKEVPAKEFDTSSLSAEDIDVQDSPPVNPNLY